jgi:hypothetical protein
VIDGVMDTLRGKINEKPTGYLKNSYQNLISYFSTTVFKKDIPKFLNETSVRDKRRGTDCRAVFPKLFEELDA